VSITGWTMRSVATGVFSELLIIQLENLAITDGREEGEGFNGLVMVV